MFWRRSHTAKGAGRVSVRRTSCVHCLKAQTWVSAIGSEDSMVPTRPESYADSSNVTTLVTIAVNSGPSLSSAIAEGFNGREGLRVGT